MTNIKAMNCISCQRFCEKIDKNQLIHFLEQEKVKGVDEVVFSCELQDNFKELVSQVETNIKIGEKNKRGKIIFLN